MEGAFKQPKVETTQRWSHSSGSGYEMSSNPMHSSLAATANMVTSSHMLISQERITWFSNIPTEVGGVP